MRVAKLAVQGFRAFRQLNEINCGPFTTIVGRNDTGKSSILHALEVFFDGPPEERDFNRDLGLNAPIVIQVSLTGLPDSVEFEEGVETQLGAERLLDSSGHLTIRKTYERTNPKKPKATLWVNDYVDPQFQNLCSLKERDLNERGKALGLDFRKSGAGITNKSKRGAIRQLAAQHGIKEADIEIEPSEAAQRALDYLPEFSLFRANESLSEEETAFQREFKAIVETAVGKIGGKAEIERGVEAELDTEMQKIHAFLLSHTDEVASIKVRPSFKWKDLISFYLECKDNQGQEIAFSKRGSGLRRLLMVAYFQYLAQRNGGAGSSKGRVYAIEEPETYLHPGAQRDLLESFREITATDQVLVTSHSPVFAGSTGTGSLVLVTRQDGMANAIQGDDLDLATVAFELGVEPADQIYGYRAVAFVEGFEDYDFFSTVAETLHSDGRLPSTFRESRIGVVPCGGDNLKLWITRQAMRTLNRRFAVILDSDKKSSQDPVPARKAQLKTGVEQDGGVCFILRKREIENYLHPAVIEQHTGKTLPAANLDFLDLKKAVGPRVARLVRHMSAEQILERDVYSENGIEKHELCEICREIINLATD
jgi:AAA ATPase domain